MMMTAAAERERSELMGVPKLLMKCEHKKERSFEVSEP